MIILKREKNKTKTNKNPQGTQMHFEKDFIVQLTQQQTFCVTFCVQIENGHASLYQMFFLLMLSFYYINSKDSFPNLGYAGRTEPISLRDSSYLGIMAVRVAPFITAITQ